LVGFTIVQQAGYNYQTELKAGAVGIEAVCLIRYEAKIVGKLAAFQEDWNGAHCACAALHFSVNFVFYADRWCGH